MKLKANVETGKMEYIKTGQQFVSLQGFGPKPNAKEKREAKNRRLEEEKEAEPEMGRGKRARRS